MLKSKVYLELSLDCLSGSLASLLLSVVLVMVRGVVGENLSLALALFLFSIIQFGIITHPPVSLISSSVFFFTALNSNFCGTIAAGKNPVIW
jgi:hypothetical protein